MANKLLNYIVLATVVLLTGCASFYDETVANPDSYHAPQRVDESYNISGRFSIVNAQKDYYGNFNWEHYYSSDHLSLMTPLGNSVAQIIVESTVATLQTTDGTYTGSDLDKLLINNLGFSLPVNYLHYWVQGIPLPNYPIENSLKSGFTQLGWNVEYLKWQDANHPQIVQVSNDKLRIKLLVNWSVE